MTDLFTVEKANRTLPLVRQVAQDMVRDSAALRASRKSLRALMQEPVLESAEPRIAELQAEIAELSGKLHDYAVELQKLGILVRDFEQAQLEFPASVHDLPAWLCWIPSDGPVCYWHPKDTTFSARQLLSTR